MRVIVFVETEDGVREYQIARISPLDPGQNKISDAVVGVLKSAVFSPDGRTYYPAHRILRVEVHDDSTDTDLIKL